MAIHGVSLASLRALLQQSEKEWGEYVDARTRDVEEKFVKTGAGR